MRPFDQIVIFDMPREVSDGMGGTESGWTLAHTCTANYRFLRGGETVQAARLTGRQPVVVTIWNCVEARAITPDYRMQDSRTGVVYNIRSIVPSDDLAVLELTCESGVAP